MTVPLGAVVNKKENASQYCQGLDVPNHGTSNLHPRMPSTFLPELQPQWFISSMVLLLVPRAPPSLHPYDW